MTFGHINAQICLFRLADILLGCHTNNYDDEYDETMSQTRHRCLRVRKSMYNDCYAHHDVPHSFSPLLKEVSHIKELIYYSTIGS